MSRAGSGDLELERVTIAAAQSGDEFAWRELFDEYYPRLFTFMRARVAERETAEDLAAETFVDAFRGIPRFQWREKPFGAWLFTVARSRLQTHYRRRPTPAQTVLSEPGFAVDETLQVDVRDALGRLPRDYREALELRYLLGLSGVEAAAVMGRSHGAFRMLLQRASQAFKAEYGFDDRRDAA